MSISLSPRLKACSNFIHIGDKVADVGCDHGYLGIYLLTEGIASKVIASDINEGPLQSARNNAEKYGVKDKMSFHLSDGVQNIPQAFDVLVCAGMGADTMISILEAAPWLKKNTYRLILQCQSKTSTLRQYLDAHGWHIHCEEVLRDGRFLYTVMEVLYQPEAPRLTNSEYYITPALLRNPSPEAKAYYQQILSRIDRAIIGQGENAAMEFVNTQKALKALVNAPEHQWLKEDNL